MSAPGVVLANRILARHGSRPDLRLWRNETAGAWVGKRIGGTTGGDTILRGARMIQAGLCRGSADLIGLTDTGRFIALEVKASGDRLSAEQITFLGVVNDLGGIGEVVESVADADLILGEPPS